MTYTQIKKLLDKALEEAIGEALEDEVDIASPEFQVVLRKLKTKILKGLGTTLEAFEEYEKKENLTPTPRFKLEGAAEIKGEKGDKGDRGDSIKGDKGDTIIGPVGKDGHTPTKKELLKLIKPLIPVVKDGKDGKDGKTIFRGKQGPKGEKGDPTPAISNPLTEKRVLEMTHKEQERIIEPMRRLAMGLQGQIDAMSIVGAGTVENLSSQCDGSTTAFTTTKTIIDVAWLSLNGTNLIEIKDFTVSGNTITLSTVTPDSGEELYVKYT